MASFETVADRARETPILSTLPSLASFYLSDFNIYNTVDGFHRDLYDPDYLFDSDVIVDTEARHPDYPRLDCSAEPVTPALNDVVRWEDREHHERIHRELLRQSDIKDYILDRVVGEEFVAVVIVDGLSYEAVRPLEFEVKPVIVDGITTTGPGFRRIIYGGDSVSIYAALTSKGFYKGYGFTYWNRGQEELSTELHSGLGQNVHRIRDFDKALSTLEADQPFDNKLYVQITRMGMDQDSHNRKEEPNRAAVRDDIAEDLRGLAEVADDITDKFRIFVTADHGILWRDELPDDPQVVKDEWADHARFLEGEHDVDHGLTLRQNGDAATGLGYPYLTRELKNTEWGVHGGFSYQESITPLIEISSAGDSV